MKRICIFGDSITWGAGLPYRGAWANLLRNHLEQQTGHGVELYDLGIDGDTTDGVLARFDAEANARRPDLVIFAIGINDTVFRKDAGVYADTTRFSATLAALAAKAGALTPNVWFVGLVKGSDDATVPLARSTTGKCYTKERTAAFDRAIALFCREHGLPFVDVFALLTDADFDDGLHPNLSGHEKIFTAVHAEFVRRGIVPA